jgi:hypothetical protein
MRKFLIAAAASAVLAFYAAGVGAPAAAAANTGCLPNHFYYTYTGTTGMAAGQTWQTQMSIRFAGVTGTGHVLEHMNARNGTYAIEVGLFSGWAGDGMGNVYYSPGVSTYTAVTDDFVHYNFWQGSAITPGNHVPIALSRNTGAGTVWTSYVNGSAIYANDLIVGITQAQVGTEDALNGDSTACGTIDAAADQSNRTLGQSVYCATDQNNPTACRPAPNNAGCKFSVGGGLNKGFESYVGGTSPFWGCTSAYNNCPPNCPAAPVKQGAQTFSPPPSVPPRFTGWSHYAPTP